MTNKPARRPPRSGSMRMGVIFVLFSQLAVLIYLYRRWPMLDHPWEPPVSSLGTSNVKPDGFFHGIPITYRSGANPSSSVQCIGENFEPNSWLFRSCRYQNVCYNVQEREFFYYPSAKETDLVKAIRDAGKEALVTLSTVQTPKTALSLAAIHPDLTLEQERDFQWVPPHGEPSTVGFYEFPPNVVLVAVDGKGGDWIWDKFYPVYTLLSTFGLTSHLPLLLPRQPQTNDSYHPFLPLLMGYTGGSTLDQVPAKSPLICARQAVAGMGMIADRGHNLPGRYQTKGPSKTIELHPVQSNLFTHNLAQGRILRGYRDYILRNLGISPGDRQEDSSFEVSWYGLPSNPSLQAEFRSVQPNSQFHQLSPWTSLETLKETAQTISLSSVLMVQCCSSEAALAATFLPNGASLVIYFRKKEAARIWDLIDNAAYIKTHWVPIGQDDIVVRAVRQDYRP